MLFFTGSMLVFLYIIIFPSDAFQASSAGLNLWFYTILPTLLPFIILSDLLVHSGILQPLLSHTESFFQKFFGLSGYGGYALFLGLFCGYPIGAKITADLYRQERISVQEADYLLTFVNNASPGFLQGYLLFQILQLENLRILTFLIFYGSLFLTSVIFRFFIFRKTRCFHSLPPAADQRIPSPMSSVVRSSVERLFDTSIMNGLETAARLGGYLMVFSLLSSMICKAGAAFPFLTPLFASLMELTTGLSLLKSCGLPPVLLYLLALTLTSFGGISTIAQTRGMLCGTPLSIRTYIIGKLVNACCTFFLVCIAILVFFCI